MNIKDLLVLYLTQNFVILFENKKKSKRITFFFIRQLI